MKLKTALSFVLLIQLSFTNTLFAAEIYFHANNDGEIYQLCKDDENIRVFRDNGHVGTYGDGYSLSDVISEHNLKTTYLTSKTLNECPDKALTHAFNED
jgi:hypothetical protein